MSSSAYIDINLAPRSDLDIVSLIEALSQYGWELNNGSSIGYLPLGDNCSFSWTFVGLDKNTEVIAEIRNKHRAHEILGIMVHLKNTVAGASLLYIPEEHQISFSLWDTTKLSNGINDFGLYEKNLLPWIAGEKIQFDSIHMVQIDSAGQIEFEKRLSQMLNE